MVNVKPMQKGERFGKLIILGEREKRESGIFEKCLCDCGNVKWISRNHLRRGASNSCGCLMRETSKKSMIKMNTKHGMFGTRIYSIFNLACTRCNNPKAPNYKRYGGRGIKMLWNNFEDFYRDMGESYKKHVKEYGELNTTLDRINVNGNYCKENCRWATRIEQANNRTNNVFIEYKGERMSLSDFCRKYNINYKVARNRYYKGFNIFEVLCRLQDNNEERGVDGYNA